MLFGFEVFYVAMQAQNSLFSKGNWDSHLRDLNPEGTGLV